MIFAAIVGVRLPPDVPTKRRAILTPKRAAMMHRVNLEAVSDVQTFKPAISKLRPRSTTVHARMQKPTSIAKATASTTPMPMEFVTSLKYLGVWMPQRATLTQKPM